MSKESQRETIYTIAGRWWFNHCNPDGPAGHGAARAFRAASRRIRSPVGAYTLQETVALHHALEEAGYLQRHVHRHTRRVGVIAAVLGQIDHSRSKDNRQMNYAAVLMGAGKERPAVSPLRFQRLIRSNAAELLSPLRRALGLIDFRCDAAQLANDLFYWGDDVKARWCLQYYGDTQSPTTTNTTIEETPT